MYNENWRERDKVYEEIPDIILKPQKSATPKAKGCPAWGDSARNAPLVCL